MLLSSLDSDQSRVAYPLFFLKTLIMDSPWSSSVAAAKMVLSADCHSWSTLIWHDPTFELSILETLPAKIGMCRHGSDPSG